MKNILMQLARVGIGPGGDGGGCVIPMGEVLALISIFRKSPFCIVCTLCAFASRGLWTLPRNWLLSGVVSVFVQLVRQLFCFFVAFVWQNSRSVFLDSAFFLINSDSRNRWTLRYWLVWVWVVCLLVRGRASCVWCLLLVSVCPCLFVRFGW